MTAPAKPQTTAETRAPAIVRAKPGDAILIRQHHGTGDTYETGIATSVSSDGAVRQWVPVWIPEWSAGDEGVPLPAHEGLWILPAEQFDVPAVVAAARAHHWPGRPDQPVPFASLDEAKAALAPCRKPVATPLRDIVRLRNLRTGRDEIWGARSADGRYAFTRTEESRTPWQVTAEGYDGFVFAGSLLAAQKMTASGYALAELERQQAEIARESAAR